MPPTPQRAAPGSLEALKERNRHRVVAALRSHGSLSRAAVARMTGLSRSTVSSVVSDLLRQGVVREGTTPILPTSGGGRPATPLWMDQSAGIALSIDLAPSGLRVALSDLGHNLVASGTDDFDPDDEGLPSTLARVADLVARTLAGADLDRDRVIGAAMSVPAPVVRSSRRPSGESVLRSIVDIPIEETLTGSLGVPTMIENDANLCALGELVWGAAAGHEDVVYLELSKGIGAGIVLGGALHRGAGGMAGEVGHIRVVPDGPLCRCGNRGCLEMFAGTDAVAGLVADRFDEWPTIEMVVAHAEAGDAVCRRALRDAGARIGSVVATVCNVLNPTIVIVGGELAPAWQVMESALRESLDRSAVQSAAAGVTLAPSTLGPRARVLGGLALVLRDSATFPGLAAAAPPQAAED